MNAGFLELLIESYCVIGTYEPDGELRREAFERMRQLIAKRSSEQISRMEVAQGLR